MSVVETSPRLATQELDPQIVSSMIDLRRDLHQHPELSSQEHRSSTIVFERLRELGLSPRRVLETGVVVDLPGPADVPMVALRADMDALPIHEETGLAFASASAGVMHACGHDGHTAMVLGAADILRPRQLPAPVRLIFQPAEEIAQGARRMVEAGVLEGVGLVFGVHLDIYVETGRLIVTPGPVNASNDDFRIRVLGQAAHAARPHQGVDSVVIGSAIVTALQTIISREIDPALPAVITVGSFHAGTASNVIAGEALLKGTIRAQLPEVREQLIASVRRVAESVAALHGARVECAITAGTPPVINLAGATDLARQAAALTVGEQQIVELEKANMGGEDFSEYLQRVEGCFIRVAAGFKDRENFPQHSSRFDFDESALAIGARYFANIADIAGRHLAET